MIDPDYTGNVGVLICNGGQTEFTFNKGDRCAQLIVEKIYMPEVMEVKFLGETKRGDKGVWIYRKMIEKRSMGTSYKARGGRPMEVIMRINEQWWKNVYVYMYIYNSKIIA